MDIFSATKLFSEVTKLLKKKEVNLSQELANLKIIYGSLEYSINSITDFYKTYLNSTNLENIKTIKTDLLKSS